MRRWGAGVSELTESDDPNLHWSKRKKKQEKKVKTILAAHAHAPIPHWQIEKKLFFHSQKK